MRKLLLFVAIAFMSISMGAQNQFRAGIAGGLPIGDAGDFATFALAVDLAYLFEISDSFEAGPTVGYSHSFGEDFTQSFAGQTVTFEAQDIQFIPVGGSARFEVAPMFKLGADLGYAVGVNDGNDGGFYYSPRAQYGVSEAIDIVVAFRGVSVEGGSWDIISAGIELGLD